MPDGSVLFFGDINVDNIFLLPEFPAPGRDGYASHAEMHLGGTMCNSAAVIQRLGQPARLLGALGDDIWSGYVFKKLHEAQIDGRHVIIKKQTLTGLIFIAVTPNGERTMFSYRGANLTIQPEDLPADLLDDICLVELTGYVFMHAPQKETAWQLVEKTAQRGIPISMDTGLDPVILAPEMIQAVLPYLSILITGEEEAQRLTQTDHHQDQVEALLARGVNHVAIKLGSEGACLGWPGGFLYSPAFPVQVVDTTSAGDAFSAGLIYGILHDFSPNASLVLANALGGLATTVPGAAWIGRDEVVSFLTDKDQVRWVGRDGDAIDEVIQRLSARL